MMVDIFADAVDELFVVVYLFFCLDYDWVVFEFLVEGLQCFFVLVEHNVDACDGSPEQKMLSK